MLVTAHLLKTLAFVLNMIQLHPFDHQLPQSDEPRKTILLFPGNHIDFAQVNAICDNVICNCQSIAAGRTGFIMPVVSESRHSICDLISW